MSKRILIANKFLHHVGGVETYVTWLSRHLSGAGYEVAFFGMEPPADDSLMPLEGQAFFAPYRTYHGRPRDVVLSAANSIYSPKAAAAMRHAIKTFAPDLVHFQSTCYQLTPSVVREVNQSRIPAVVTAHEYKFVCSNQRLWDDGRDAPCSKCLGQSVPKRIQNVTATRCVKGALGSSLLAAAELPASEAVWRKFQGIVHAPSLFIKHLLDHPTSPVSGRVEYLDLAWAEPHNSLAAPTTAAKQTVAFTGRLSREKGVDVLLRAWIDVAKTHPSATLEIHGSGDEEVKLRGLASRLGCERVHFRGRYTREDLPAIFASTTMTVHPSRWAENSPYTVRESLQYGVPAIVTDAGGMPEMVSGATGTVVAAGDHEGLARAITNEFENPRARGLTLREAVAARAVSDRDHLEGLADIYHLAGLPKS